VLEVIDNHFDGNEQGVKVVCLNTGEASIRHHGECEYPVIKNVFDISELINRQ